MDIAIKINASVLFKIMFFDFNCFSFFCSTSTVKGKIYITPKKETHILKIEISAIWLKPLTETKNKHAKEAIVIRKQPIKGLLIFVKIISLFSPCFIAE